MREVKKERSGWRDEALSQRHRLWGWDCPAVDIDFLMLEYDKGEPKAIVEYKNEHAKPQYPNHPSYRALIALCNRAEIPMIACRYSDDLSTYQARTLNKLAQNYIPFQETMTEMQWVNLLYKIRGKSIPKEVLKNIGICV